MWLGRYDPDKKRSLRDKLATASDRYRRKWGEPATAALVNPDDYLTAEPDIHDDFVSVAAVRHVAPNTVYVGRYDKDDTGGADTPV